MAKERINPGWVYMCADGSFAHQVRVQKLKSGKIRIVCMHTGGQSVAVSEKLMEQVQEMIDAGALNWKEVDVEEVED